MAKSKLSSVETLVSQALIDLEISHEEFITILKEKDEYEKMKEKCKKCEWEIRKKTRKHEIKQCKFKDLKKLQSNG